MSQAGIIEFESAHPSVPTSFVTDDGTAVPIANVLEILGTVVPNHHIPLETTGSGNTVTIVTQYAAATSGTTTTDAGVASFNSAEFTVDANGFVSLTGNEPAIESVAVQTGTSPIVPTAGGQITINGATVLAGTHPVRTDGTGPNTLAVEVQLSQAIAGTNATNVGLSAFNSADFTVDSNGFVSSLHNGTITSVLTANATPQFTLVGTVETVDFNLSNLVLGSSLPSIAGAARNVGMGSNSMAAATSVTDSTAVGYQALQAVTTGNNNCAFGSGASTSIQTGQYNNAFGQSALTSCVSGFRNAAFGYSSLGSCTVSDNTAYGEATCFLLQTGTFNTALGGRALHQSVSGSNNVSVGYESLSNALGSNNIAVGYLAGNTYVGTESSNILIGNNGTLSESNVIRIGTAGSGSGQQSTAYMAGITGVTAVGSPVAVSSTGQLSDLGFGTSTYVLTSNGAGVSPTWQPVSASGGVENFTVDAITGTGVNPVVPNAGNIRVSADVVTQQGIVIRTQTPSPNKYNVEVQYCDSNNGALATKSGMSHFNSNQFTVDNTTGYVSLSNPITFISGTWTPILYGATTAGTTTYVTNEGTYVQFGNLVWVRAFIRVSATTGTGTAMVGGFPFTVLNNSASFTNSNLGLSDSWVWPSGSTAPILAAITGTTTAQMAMNGSGLTTQYMQMQSGSISIAFNFVYQVS